MAPAPVQSQPAKSAIPSAGKQDSTDKPKGARKSKKQESVVNKEQQSGERQTKKPSGRGQDGFEALLEPFYDGKSLTDPIDTAKDKWNLLPAFLKVKGLVKQHIDSFNYFVEVDLKKIVKANPTVLSQVERRFYLTYTDIYIGRPNRQEEDGIRDVLLGKTQSTITPHECRLREATYAAPILVNISYWRGSREVRRKGVCIGRIPIMLRSDKCVLSRVSEREMSRMNECPLDPGGYFIVNGTEKVVLVQEQLSKNRILVEKGVKNADFQASVTSTTHERKSKTYVFMRWGRIFLKHNFISEDIPIVIVFKALGVSSDHEIFQLVAGNDAAYQDTFSINFEEASKLQVNTQQEALEYIGRRIQLKGRFSTPSQRRNFVQEGIEALSSVIINHIPINDLNYRPKALYFAYMVRRVLMACHDHSLVDERDYVGNKRLELAGQLLSLLFEDSFKKFNQDFKKNIDKVLSKPARTEEFDALRYFESQRHIITQSMQRAIVTGNWDLKRFKMKRAGVTHVLSRLSYISALGMMTRITSQFEKTRKVSGPRSLQPSQFGMLCPSDTPEGESCGLVKNLALMTHITTNDEESPIRGLIYVLGARDIELANGKDLYADGTYIILINGTPTALTSNPDVFVMRFRSLRRTGRISEFVSIYIDGHVRTIKIATDEGRICRPLIIVEKGRSKVTVRSLQALRKGRIGFDDFLARGLVEYLDVNEENDSLIAMYEGDINQQTTHLEIEPFTILGAVAGLIPYPHHNQSPRNTYQCAMGKQAIGTIAYNQFQRLDTLLYLLVYPQVPLVKTRAIELIKYDKLPAGQNAIVAVMSYSGYDIEDALVLNKASCDRGFGRCQIFRRMCHQLRTFPNGQTEGLASPAYDENGILIKKHAVLDHDGIAQCGEKISIGEAYMVKEMPLNTNNLTLTSDSRLNEYAVVPMMFKGQNPCQIDKVMLSNTEQETKLVKIQTRETRIPEVGDKFSSRHGQKGVVGLIAAQTDMPFTDDGIVPDLIMNPHGFPSRMTVGKMLELIAGKAGVLVGEPQYGTAFGGSKVDDMTDILISHGFSYTGKDFLTSGITGEPLAAYVFMGPIYYQKLKHMVADKMHARSRGPKAMLTRQPMEGRSRDGGLRLGEMERDCLIAYGASQLLLERLMHSSDAHTIDVCQSCGLMGFQGWCQNCKKSERVSPVTIPYAAKLLVQELTSMGVVVRMGLEDQYPN